jgi:uncharacterized protein (TIGR02284 family)
MSVDERVTRDLIQTLEDGREGFSLAADRLADSGRTDLVSQFREYSSQRADFAAELREMASDYGDVIDNGGNGGTVAGAVHRGWITVKDAISGGEPREILEAAEQGEDHAVTEYEKALENDDISPQLRQVIARQASKINSAHDNVRALRDSA